MTDNIWIKKIVLLNWQKHSKLEIEFTNGVNIIHGDTNAGKSCIRRAIEWVIENKKFSEKTIRKIGSKQTSVIITFSNLVEVERVKSSSINRYILRVPEKDELVFNAIGKTIPTEISEAIGIFPIEIDGEEHYLNSAPQLGLPFLFDKSPTQRMKLFNKLTGNDLLDKLFVEFNKDILRINRDLKETKLSVETQVSAIAEKEIEKEQLEARYFKAKDQLLKIDKLVVEYNTLSQVQENKELTEKNLEVVTTNLDSIKIPEDIDFKALTNTIEAIKGLYSLQDALQSTKNINEVNTRLSGLNIPTLNLDEILGIVDRLDKLQTICYTLNEVQSKSKVTEEQILDNENDLNSKQN